jgi:Fe-S cluster biogenesis protein NfuA
MFIQTETTPNPKTLKFIPGCSVMENGKTADFTFEGDSEQSPLAQSIFKIGGISRIFFGSDFISITRNDVYDNWDILKPQILASIMDHYTSGLPIVNFNLSSDDETYSSNDTISKIKELLDSRIRPMVANDGGDITFDRFEEGIVYLHMQGACSGCPSSTATLKHGIENLLRHYVPEVLEVRAA